MEVNWIMLKDKLPEDGTYNLFTDGKSISVERFKCDAIDHFWPQARWFELEDAIAWIPLKALYPLPEKKHLENDIYNIEYWLKHEEGWDIE